MQNSSVKSNGMFVNFILIAIALGAWFGSEEVTKRLGTVPIKSIPKTGAAPKPVDSKTLYPVLVEFKKHTEVKDENGDFGVENVFNKKEQRAEKKEPAPPPIDHAAEIARSLRLSGIGIDGAFINDTYYRVNDPIFEAARTTDTVKIVPKLVKIDREEVSILIEKKTIIIRLSK